MDSSEIKKINRDIEYVDCLKRFNRRRKRISLIFGIIAGAVISMFLSYIGVNKSIALFFINLF
jgi:tetrahydromethanopterin S-methyltransferase subunit G